VRLEEGRERLGEGVLKEGPSNGGREENRADLYAREKGSARSFDREAGRKLGKPTGRYED
jgi:hypothetical protein